MRISNLYTIDSPCAHTNPDSLDARLLPSVVLAVAPAVTIDIFQGAPVGSQSHSRISSLRVCARVPFVL